MISLDYLVHVGALIFLIAYLVRDQILLNASRNWNDILHYILFIDARAALICAYMELNFCAD